VLRAPHRGPLSLAFCAAAPGYGVPAAAAVPSRGLDRLLQAARERKKQQAGIGAPFAPQRGAAPELTRAVLGAGFVDTAAAPPSNRVPWRSRLSAANATFPDTPERQHWLLQLMLAAKGGDIGRSRQLLADMSLDGHPPGPREFHIAVAAHALAGDATGALRVMQDQHARGGRALFETCVPARRALSRRGCADAAAARSYKAIIRVAAGQGMPDVAIEAQEGAYAPRLWDLLRRISPSLRVPLQLLRAPGTTTRPAGVCLSSA
jgi:hypothetical protein